MNLKDSFLFPWVKPLSLLHKFMSLNACYELGDKLLSSPPDFYTHLPAYIYTRISAKPLNLLCHSWAAFLYPLSNLHQKMVVLVQSQPMLPLPVPPASSSQRNRLSPPLHNLYGSSFLGSNLRHSITTPLSHRGGQKPNPSPLHYSRNLSPEECGWLAHSPTQQDG